MSKLDAKGRVINGYKIDGVRPAVKKEMPGPVITERMVNGYKVQTGVEKFSKGHWPFAQMNVDESVFIPDLGGRHIENATRSTMAQRRAHGKRFSYRTTIEDWEGKQTEGRRFWRDE